MRYLLPASLLIVFLAGCASQAQQAPKPSGSSATPPAKTTPPRESSPVIVFRKTPCFGFCPHYEASIYADGRVLYEGFNKYAPVQGKRELQLSAATLNTILAEARTLHFSELPERYASGASDLPSTSLSVRQGSGAVKTVTVEDGAPVELQNLLRYVEKQVSEALGVPADR